MVRSSVIALCCMLAAPVACAGAQEAQATAPANPYNGMQEREEVFEFTVRPEVKKDDGKWFITFASKAACDATVSIVDKDGKIVRHLASGVLGKNAPWPFQQNSLVQKLEWDGKDDEGRAAPPGCQVKVSLGLKAEFEAIEKQHLFSGIRAMTVDKDGRLYVAMANGVLSESVHVFDRRGKLVGAIWPPSRSVPPDKASVLTWNKTIRGERVPMRNRFGGGWSFDIMAGVDFFENARGNGAAVAPDGRVVFLSAGGARLQGARLLFLDPTDGSCPPGSFVDVKGVWTTTIAIPPDGKWIYFSGKVAGHGSPGASHAVQRAPLDKPGSPAIFVGEIATAGTDNAHFKSPTRVACDKGGNVYVGDTGNGRIQVYRPDGTYLKTIPGVPGELVGVSHKTGAIYCMWQSDKWPKPMVISKLGGLENPAKTAEITLGLPKGGEAYTSATAVVDPFSDPPAIWFIGNFRANPSAPAMAVRIEDRGDKLVQAVDLLAANGLSDKTGETDGGLDSHQYYIAADKRSGVLAPGACGVGPDGLWYFRKAVFASDMHWVVRFDPRKNEYVPFEHNGDVVKQLWDAKSAETHNGKPVIGLRLYAHTGGPHSFQSPFAVAPNGDIYAMTTTGQKHLDDMTKAGIFNTGKSSAFDHIVLVYGPDGTLKSPAALTGLWDTDGLRVGRSGAVYLVQGAKPLGQALPDGLAADAKYHPSRWGSLIKFAGNFEKFPIGRVIGIWEGKDADNPTHEFRTKVRFENSVWSYGGVSPISAASGSCTCLKSSFDLDAYERSFVPAAHTCSVTVVDANGNVVARLGNYGNMSDLVPGKPPAFDIPRSVAVADNALWVHDAQHRAIIRSKLSYAAEETAAMQ